MIRFSSVFRFSIPMLLVAALLCPASFAAVSPVSKMRPYAGIGILVLPVSDLVDDEPFERLRLYDEPAMFRLENAALAGSPRYDWLFAMDADSLPVIVTARKGEWLKIVYDEAGREGWVKPWRQSEFETWDDFFKGRFVRLLPGLQKRYYQLFTDSGADLLAGVTPTNLFKVIQLNNDWVQVQDDRNLAGWLRWRDEDGRLLIKLEQGGPPPS